MIFQKLSRDIINTADRHLRTYKECDRKLERENTRRGKFRKSLNCDLISSYKGRSWVKVASYNIELKNTS